MCEKICLARKTLKNVVTLVTIAHEALFYKGLGGNQQHEKFGYGNLKSGYLGGDKDAGVNYAKRTTHYGHDQSGDRAVPGKNGKPETEENIAKDLLMTKYRKPYMKLQQELKVMTEQIVRDVAAYYLPTNSICAGEAVKELNHQIDRFRIREKISDAVFRRQDADLVLKYAMQVRQLAWETARRWDYGG